jgi:hypothetical protein
LTGAKRRMQKAFAGLVMAVLDPAICVIPQITGSSHGDDEGGFRRNDDRGVLTEGFRHAF